MHRTDRTLPSVRVRIVRFGRGTIRTNVRSVRFVRGFVSGLSGSWGVGCGGFRLMLQTRRHSLLEAVANVVVGYGVAVTTQVLFLPRFGLIVPWVTTASATGAAKSARTSAPIARSRVMERAYRQGGGSASPGQSLPCASTSLVGGPGERWPMSPGGAGMPRCGVLGRPPEGPFRMGTS